VQAEEGKTAPPGEAPVLLLTEAELAAASGGWVTSTLIPAIPLSDTFLP
jgi:hypothetical protein